MRLRPNIASDLGADGNHFRRDRAAFTLLEMVVVVALIAILAAAIVPEMRGTMGDARLRASGRQLIDVIDMTCSRAVSLNQLHRLRFEPGTGRYRVERRASREDRAEKGRRFVPAREIPGFEGEIDRRVSLHVRPLDGEPMETPAGPGSGPTGPAEPAPMSATASEGPPGDEAISFYPDGTADASELMLEERDGFRLLLRINPVTARVEVRDLDRK
ncbi:MAG TPA: prepilin-type N-terminal cleavage/methylation domain-containing protein [Verrucomicrobiae bacterium]|nr:prepilin-type N-terminal cleavage/methylation domain-containing protein [Verrucomicrobiae bacterium]